MTEAMSRREIEDVLTSIRRLVSHDVHAETKPGATATRPEKLVLTSALRVDEAATGASSGDMDKPAGPATSDSHDSAQTGTKLAADMAANMAEHPGEPAEGTDPPVSSARASLIARIAKAGENSLPTQGPVGPDAPRAPLFAAARDQALPSGDTAPPDDAGQSIPRSPTGEEPRHAAPASEPLTGGGESDNTLADAEASSSLEDAALEATLARLEAALSGKAQAVPAGQSAEATATTGEQVIDEGMLYQIVAHIVRQELQGELGEKITRNIRKLVRTEVARELQLRKS